MSVFRQQLSAGALVYFSWELQLQLKEATMFVPEKCACVTEATIYWKFFFVWFKTAVQRAVHQGYHNARTVVKFNPRSILPNMSKDVLPMHATSSVIYKFVCCCDNSLRRTYLSEIGKHN